MSRLVRGRTFLTRRVKDETEWIYSVRKLFTVENDITSENVANILNSVLPAHVQNMAQEEYLFRYRRGVQPILSRTKNVRPEINNKVAENHANEIVAFKNGYFLTQPAFYVSRSEDTDAVKRMNDYLYLCGKQQADNDVVDWFHTVGIRRAVCLPICKRH